MYGTWAGGGGGGGDKKTRVGTVSDRRRTRAHDSMIMCAGVSCAGVQGGGVSLPAAPVT